MAAGRTVNVLLRKFVVPAEPERVEVARFSAECRLLGILLKCGSLTLWNIAEKSHKSLASVKT